MTFEAKYCKLHGSGTAKFIDDCVLQCLETVFLSRSTHVGPGGCVPHSIKVNVCINSWAVCIVVGYGYNNLMSLEYVDVRK